MMGQIMTWTPNASIFLSTIGILRPFAKLCAKERRSTTAVLRWNRQAATGSGAKIFVHPNQYAQAFLRIVEHGINLRPFHVIVAESFEYHVEACLADVPYRQGARVKNRCVIHEPAAAEDASTPASAERSLDISESAEEQEIPIVAKRTFICSAPRLRNQQSVTQSTEVHSGGVNPRRACISGSS
eukprot:gnl/MRDRNA2_/MRDRNA2_266887_c0_seq1.p1 gnl/MRDRNA2_/MRDRNA2_266887_c0~~gnl/MRDRNA2_/MRDRNA2_266887_c0_seq1.p1  ORF type:complete len:185 (+),score=27.32 gnl/MRDRNA2_/MRDRNA2_266887_c0_seq1:454-1008(+)